jgi:hypothetical protein
MWGNASKNAMSEVGILQERLRGLDIALALQAKEYERRLETLNHEAQRIQEILAKSVTVERFDDYVANQDTARNLARTTIVTQMDSGYARLELLVHGNRDSIVTLNQRLAVSEGNIATAKSLAEGASTKSRDYTSLIFSGLAILLTLINSVFAYLGGAHIIHP